MRSFPTLALGAAALALVFAGAAPATAQIPDKFTNLKVLPEDIGREKLISIMKEFSSGLGVRCSFCHVPGDNPHSLEGFDFASDKPEHKAIAREMMKMAGKINGTLLPATGIENPMQIRCVTCHRGVSDPETLDNVLLETIQEKGVEEAVTKYRDLRKTYYGSGSYDFSPASLNGLAETLAREKQDLAGAMAIVELNLEFYPEEAEIYVMRGQLQAAQGDTEAAVGSVKKALALDPENRWAKRMLQQLEASGN